MTDDRTSYRAALRKDIKRYTALRAEWATRAIAHDVAPESLHQVREIDAIIAEAKTELKEETV